MPSLNRGVNRGDTFLSRIKQQVPLQAPERLQKQLEQLYEKRSQQCCQQLKVNRFFTRPFDQPRLAVYTSSTHVETMSAPKSNYMSYLSSSTSSNSKHSMDGYVKKPFVFSYYRPAFIDLFFGSASHFLFLSTSLSCASH